VNVQTLRVSFLRVDEIYQLITQPIPAFPGEHIFCEEAVEEIINVTGCHPFLVQAVCSALINDLKADKRNQAETQDVVIAVNKVLEIWWDTYFQDLWKRTDQGQRICLAIVKNLGKGDLQKIAQHSEMEESVVRSILQTLLKRDLVVLEQGSYRITTPIFNEWIERSS